MAQSKYLNLGLPENWLPGFGATRLDSDSDSDSDSTSLDWNSSSDVGFLGTRLLVRKLFDRIERLEVHKATKT